MPELPEVETVRRGLLPHLEGRRIVHVRLARADLRFPFPADFAHRLTGHRIETVARRAKYLLAGLDDGSDWLIHLGMTGRFTVVPAAGDTRNLGEFYFETGAGPDGKGPHDHVVVDLDDGGRLIYSDPRRFGVMDWIAPGMAGEHKLLAGLGIEPLGNRLDARFLAERFRGRRTPVKAALLDQRNIAGLGNIYVCEALYRARISPRRLAGSLVRKDGTPSSRLEPLAAAIRDTLTEAIAAGGSTLRDYAHVDGSQGGFQQRFDVYDREAEPCRTPGCGHVIRRIVQSGRSTFYCPGCQK